MLKYSRDQPGNFNEFIFAHTIKRIEPIFEKIAKAMEKASSYRTLEMEIGHRTLGFFFFFLATKEKKI